MRTIFTRPGDGVCPCSSEVERLVCNQEVARSIRAVGSK